MHDVADQHSRDSKEGTHLVKLRRGCPAKEGVIFLIEIGKGVEALVTDLLRAGLELEGTAFLLRFAFAFITKFMRGLFDRSRAGPYAATYEGCACNEHDRCVVSGGWGACIIEIPAKNPYANTGQSEDAGLKDEFHSSNYAEYQIRPRFDPNIKREIRL